MWIRREGTAIASVTPKIVPEDTVDMVIRASEHPPPSPARRRLALTGTDKGGDGALHGVESVLIVVEEDENSKDQRKSKREDGKEK